MALLCLLTAIRVLSIAQQPFVGHVPDLGFLWSMKEESPATE
jgi:hypothetical protein